MGAVFLGGVDDAALKNCLALDFCVLLRGSEHSLAVGVLVLDENFFALGVFPV